MQKVEDNGYKFDIKIFNWNRCKKVNFLKIIYLYSNHVYLKSLLFNNVIDYNKKY